MSSVGLRIKQKISESSHSILSVAERLGVSQQAIYKWINLGKVSKDNVQKLAKLLDTSPEWLLYGTGVESDNTINFDLLDVGASAGTGVALFDESVVQSISIDKDKFQELFKCKPSESMKIINIQGDSMQPTFKDNDFILVDIANTELADGVFVFRIDDELYVKRLQRLPNKVVALSDNSNYIPFDLPDNTQIIAKVVCAWQFNQL